MKVIVNQNVVKEDENIFVQGNLVISKDKQTIVLVSRKAPYSGDFSGVVINDTEGNFFAGDFCTHWNKGNFVLFKGNVILEQ